MQRLAINKQRFAIISGMMIVLGLMATRWGVQQWQSRADEAAVYLLTAGVLGTVFFAIGMFKGLRNAVLLEIDRTGAGRIIARQSPILPNKVEAFSNQHFAVELLPFGRFGHTLNFTPPIETQGGNRVAQIFVSPKMVAGGPEHLYAVIDAINLRAPKPDPDQSA